MVKKTSARKASKTAAKTGGKKSKSARTPARAAAAKSAAVKSATVKKKAAAKPQARAAKVTQSASKSQPPAKKPAAKAAAVKTETVKLTETKPTEAKSVETVAKVAAAKPAIVAKAAPAAVAKKPDPKAVPAAKPGVKVPGEPGEPGQPREDADSPLLDLSDVGVRKMITRAKQRGYVTYDELNKVLPSDKVSSEQIEDTMSMLNEMGINVIESEEAGRAGRSARARAGQAGRGQDRRGRGTIRSHRRSRAHVSARNGLGRVAEPRRRNRHRQAHRGRPRTDDRRACESPLTFEALTVWRDALNEGKMLLRDIIDLEAMYGAVPTASRSRRRSAKVPAPDGMQPTVERPMRPPTRRPDPMQKPEAPAPKAKRRGRTMRPRSRRRGDDFDDEGNLSLSAMEAG